MVAEELQVIIDAKVAAAVRDLRKVGQETGKTETSFKKLGAQLLKAGLAFGGAAVSIRAISTALKDSVRLAGIQEQAERGLEAALIATGDASAGSAQTLKDLASELQGVTTYGDEATISAAALFTQVSGLSADLTAKSIPAIQDFASAMGMDLQSAASLVGRSIGSTTNALSRYGIQIEEGLVGTERMDAIIGQLDSKFGGFSEAMADTASGALVQFSNSIGDLKEVGGAAILDFIEPAVRGTTQFVTEITNAAIASRNLRDVLAGETKSVDDISDALNEARRQFEIYAESTTEQGKYLAGEYGRQVTLLEAQLTAMQRVSAEQEYADAMRAEGSAAAAAAALLQAQADERHRTNLANIAEAYSKTKQGQEEALRTQIAYFSSFETQGPGTTAVIAMLIDQLENLVGTTEKLTAVTYVSMDAATKSARASMEQIQAIDVYETESHEKKLEMIEAEKAARQSVYTGMVSMAIDTWALLAQGERQQAIAAKASGIFNASINTYQAITKALATLGPVAGPIAAGVIGAMGAAQIGAIAAQPLPLERGGSFVTNGPQTIMVGDGQSPRERVTVEPLNGPYRGTASGGVTININGAVGGREEVAIWVQEGLRRAQARGAA